MILQLIITTLLAISGPGIITNTTGSIPDTGGDVGISKTLKPKLRERTAQAL